VGKTLFFILLFLSLAARAESWVLVSSDDSSKVFLSYEKKFTVQGKKSFKLKFVFNGYRDLMGLKYNSTESLYVISCDLDLIYSKQQFAFDDVELVWTFPETNKHEKASTALPKDVLEEVCIK
jgi:hypothetical protein